MSANFSIDGKRAVVTGASRGLGRAMALALAAAGADVACAASTEGAAATRGCDPRTGRTTWAFGDDLSDRAAVAALAG